jgi:hypothetical protein
MRKKIMCEAAFVFCVSDYHRFGKVFDLDDGHDHYLHLGMGRVYQWQSV